MCSILKIPVCPLYACLVLRVLWHPPSLRQAFSLWDCPSLRHRVSQNSDSRLSMPAVLFFSFQRQILISSQGFKHLEKTRRPVEKQTREVQDAVQYASTNQNTASVSPETLLVAVNFQTLTI